METQFNYLVNLAKKYEQYSENSELLFKELKELPQTIFQEVYNEYNSINSSFQPVNLLRAEIARLLIEKKEINIEVVEDLKEKIRKKDSQYFMDYSIKIIHGLKNYKPTKEKGDYFTAWNNPWKILFVFFYRGEVKETTKKYLEQISLKLKDDLNLKDYDYHCVDFQGTANFGDTKCWIALYPRQKNSHQEAYQFFIKITSNSEAGRYAGNKINETSPNIIKKVSSYSEILNIMSELKPEIIKLNNETRNYYKFAPGKQAIHWTRFYNSGIMAIDFRHLNLGDLTKYKTQEELNLASGFAIDKPSNETWNLWLFYTAKIGDVVFANKGTNTCIGIGIIESEYYYEEDVDGYNHKRKVKWLTNKKYEFKPRTLGDTKNLFRVDTFSPTKLWNEIIKGYCELYPELIPLFNENKLYYKQISKHNSKVPVENPKNEEITKPENYWWLNANPKIWRIGDDEIGELQTYTSHNEKGNKRRIYKYFEEAKPGDILIGYEATPTKQIKAIYKITKGLHKNDEEGEIIEFQLIEKLDIPIKWIDLKNDILLKNSAVFNNNQGSLFKLTEEEYDVIREIIDNKKDLIESSNQSYDKYTFSEDSDKPFIDEDKFLGIVNLLRRKINIILQGPPGVGKTFLARKIAYQMMEEINDSQIEMVQFHQSYSYEDFIQGHRPMQDGSFALKNGIFYSFCQLALEFPKKKFFFIIDEINRGNLSKIFGELMMLIEPDKRSEKYAIKLTYNEENDDRFYIPENVYIIGTMNTADRSLAIVDYALRRRFSFVTLQPDYNGNFKNFLTGKGLSPNLIDHICNSVVEVNKNITADSNLGDGFQIGHSYFCRYSSDDNAHQWWKEIVDYEIEPLLKEYWFDDDKKVKDMSKILKYPDEHSD